MEMLSQEVRRFIEELKTMNTTGCILIPRAGLPRLMAALKKSLVIIGDKVQERRVTYYEIHPEASLPDAVPPALWIACEEDYSANPAWAGEIRRHAGYFLNVAEK